MENEHEYIRQKLETIDAKLDNALMTQAQKQGECMERHKAIDRILSEDRHRIIDAEKDIRLLNEVKHGAIGGWKTVTTMVALSASIAGMINVLSNIWR